MTCSGSCGCGRRPRPSLLPRPSPWREPKEHNSDDQPAGAYDDGSAHRRGAPAQPSVVARRRIQPLSCWTLASPASKAKAWLISSLPGRDCIPWHPGSCRCPQVQPTMVAAIHPAPATAQWAAPYGARENRETNVSDDVACAGRQRDLEQGVVADEHNVDPAGIVGVGVHNGIVPMRRQRCVQPSTSRSTTNRFPPHGHRASRDLGRVPWPRSPRRACRSCDHGDNQDHLIDLAHHCGAVRCRPRWPRSSRSCLLCRSSSPGRSTAVDDAKYSSFKIIT
jgi:hypothetical protein